MHLGPHIQGVVICKDSTYCGLLWLPLSGSHAFLFPDGAGACIPLLETVRLYPLRVEASQHFSVAAWIASANILVWTFQTGLFPRGVHPIPQPQPSLLWTCQVSNVKFRTSSTADGPLASGIGGHGKMPSDATHWISIYIRLSRIFTIGAPHPKSPTVPTYAPTVDVKTPVEVVQRRYWMVLSNIQPIRGGNQATHGWIFSGLDTWRPR